MHADAQAVVLSLFPAFKSRVINYSTGCIFEIQLAGEDTGSERAVLAQLIRWRAGAPVLRATSTTHGDRGLAGSPVSWARTRSA